MSVIVFIIVDFLLYLGQLNGAKWSSAITASHPNSVDKTARAGVQADGTKWKCATHKGVSGPGGSAERRCATQEKSPISIISHELNKISKV